MPSNHLISKLTVTRAPRLPGETTPRGYVKIGSLTLTCAVGKTGMTHSKREGDRATPTGTMRILYGFFRPDRLPRPLCRIPLRPVAADFGWCDDPRSPAYNRFCRLPSGAGHERLWRDDGLYDVVFVLDYNIHPRRSRRGSAIFLHCARATGSGALRPTLGCVALPIADMRRLLGRLAPAPMLRVR